MVAHKLCPQARIKRTLVTLSLLSELGEIDCILVTHGDGCGIDEIELFQREPVSEFNPSPERLWFLCLCNLGSGNLNGGVQRMCWKFIYALPLAMNESGIVN